MICRKCSNELPDGSQFCPYCLEKFTDEKEYDYTFRAKKNNKPVIILCVFSIIILMGAVFFALNRSSFTGAKSRENGNTSVSETESVIEEPNETFPEIDRDDGTIEIEIGYGVPPAEESPGSTYYPSENVIIIDESGYARNGYIIGVYE